MKNAFPLSTFACMATLSVISITMNTGCESSTGEAAAKTATAQMSRTVDTGMVNARGSVTFTVAGTGVRVVASFQGLPPGTHGFHVHAGAACGDTSAGKTSPGSAALGHFNPLSATAHGLPDSSVHHMGDLGNLVSGADSSAKLDRTFSYLTLDGANTISGHAVVVHTLEDLGTQPTGGAGGRISCGVVGAVK